MRGLFLIDFLAAMGSFQPKGKKDPRAESHYKNRKNSYFVAFPRYSRKKFSYLELYYYRFSGWRVNE
jgi:hypothetical protein